MWSQASSPSPDGVSGHKAEKLKRTTHQILPCTVSQLLSASQGSDGAFAICDRELNQVSIVGVVRGSAPSVTTVQLSVDDMTGPPFAATQRVDAEGRAPMTSFSPGTYVKGQRSLLALKSRSIKDLNEITSHMLDVVYAHKQRFGKEFDVNMNPTAASSSGGLLKVPLPDGLSRLQGRVLAALRRFSSSSTGIGFHELQAQLGGLSPRDVRKSLTFLMDEGHIFYTIDEHHFKSTES